jgi:hypothetical protein
MGQQQLLLLVLAAVIVGTGILLGVNMFQDNAAQANLDAVTQDCLTLASRAQAWYRRPVALGGGGQTFTGGGGITFDKLNFAATGINENGTYTLPTITANQLVIRGVGLEDGDDADTTPVTVDVTVNNDNVVVNVVSK